MQSSQWSLLILNRLFCLSWKFVLHTLITRSNLLNRSTSWVNTVVSEFSRPIESGWNESGKLFTTYNYVQIYWHRMYKLQDQVIPSHVPRTFQLLHYLCLACPWVYPEYYPLAHKLFRHLTLHLHHYSISVERQEWSWLRLTFLESKKVVIRTFKTHTVKIKSFFVEIFK